ncbi:hemoglobin [Plectosphaerella plurivora]|uniref:nitric oxide dioxygenase n=1 Tax=Plectosphaerella plurivora TaxID=936078 RepID=A0A9P9AFA8_9PEZI|nr:hemoglobin [Plectosphaerella plurivora]
MALTYKQSVLVQATIPSLREHGETITTLFYANMLRAHPELHNMFNTVNQANGRQPRALTSVILTFASNLHNISELIPRLERMCNKHCTMGIYPEHYDIVGKYLLEAFGIILGPTWTPDVNAAWQKAYSILARMLIGREAQMYREFEDWQGFRRFRIERKVAEAEGIYSFYLVPADGKRLPSFVPGQYVTLRVDVPALGHMQMRQYSLSDAPRPDYFRVTVKRDPGSTIGKGVEAVHLEPGIVSNVLCEEKQPGDFVELSHPAGDFNMDMTASSTVPLILISAGVGVSPLMSILGSVVERQAVRPISWLHCSARQAPFEEAIRRIAQGRSSFSTRFFRSKVADLDDGSSTASGEAGLRMDLARVDRSQLYLDHGAAEYYVCGPDAFMQEMARYLISQGVDSQRVKYEWFTTGDLVFRK